MKTSNKNAISTSTHRRLARIFSLMVCLMFVLTIFAVPAFAAGEEETNDLDNSTVVTGFKKLMADVTKILVYVCPGVGGAAAVYFLIRRSMSDEQDGKMWMRRIYLAVGCGVGGGLVSGIISLISSYF